MSALFARWEPLGHSTSPDNYPEAHPPTAGRADSLLGSIAAPRPILLPVFWSPSTLPECMHASKTRSMSQSFIRRLVVSKSPSLHYSPESGSSRLFHINSISTSGRHLLFRTSVTFLETIHTSIRPAVVYSAGSYWLLQVAFHSAVIINPRLLTVTSITSVCHPRSQYVLFTSCKC